MNAEPFAFPETFTINGRTFPIERVFVGLMELYDDWIEGDSAAHDCATKIVAARFAMPAIEAERFVDGLWWSATVRSRMAK